MKKPLHKGFFHLIIWMLDVGCRMPDTGCPMLDVDVGCRALRNTWRLLEEFFLIRAKLRRKSLFLIEKTTRVRMSIPLQIISTSLLEEYKTSFEPVVRDHFDLLVESEMSFPACNLSLAVAAVFSSGIEGDKIEFQEYVSHRLYTINDTSGLAWKVDNIYDAYQFAQNAQLSAASLVEAHAILVKNILHEPSRGKFRTHAMTLHDPAVNLTYVAVAPNLIFAEMMKWYVDLDQLLNTDLDFAEVFYYASMLHMTLCKIQPFPDGNGKLARLVEKWFLAEKLGLKAWFIFSENYYFEYSTMYKILLEKVGSEYNVLDYHEALFFLRMLPDALKNNM